MIRINRIAPSRAAKTILPSWGQNSIAALRSTSKGSFCVLFTSARSVGASSEARHAASPSGLRREQDPKSPFVFTSERGAPFATAGFARMVKRAGEAAKLGFKSHPHMLRHACGFALANKGHDTRSLQDYPGHKNIQRTVRYTELSPDRFKDFWR